MRLMKYRIVKKQLRNWGECLVNCSIFLFVYSILLFIHSKKKRYHIKRRGKQLDLALFMWYDMKLVMRNERLQGSPMAVALYESLILAQDER